MVSCPKHFFFVPRFGVWIICSVYKRCSVIRAVWPHLQWAVDDCSLDLLIVQLR